MNNAESWFIKNIKQCIVENYKIPKVQVEREIQLLLSPFIENIMNNLVGERDYSNKMKLICREFPFEKNENSNQSKNIDFLMADKDFLYFVELKTSTNNFKEDQLNEYLNLKKNKNFNNLFEHLNKKISYYDENNTPKNRKLLKKYNFLIDTIENALESFEQDMINFSDFKDIKLIYIVPSTLKKKMYSKYPDICKNIIILTLKNISEYTISNENLGDEGAYAWNIIKELFIELDELDNEF